MPAQGKTTTRFEEQVRLRYSSEGPSQLAVEFDRSKSSIRKIAFQLGVKCKTNRGRGQTTWKQKYQSMDYTYFDGPMTANKAYIGGYVWGDGSVQEYYLALECVKGDEEIIIGIRDELKSKHALAQGELYTRCYICGKDLVKSLRVLFGIERRKSYKNLSFPQIPLRFLGHFCRGVLDSDGYVNKPGRNGLGFCGTQLFIEQLQEKIAKVLDIPKNKQSITGVTWKAHWSRPEHLQKLYSFLYPVGIYLYGRRKRTLLEGKVNAC